MDLFCAWLQMEGLTLIMLQIDRTISLPCGVNDIKSFTINSCDFFFLERSGCKLIKWSHNTKIMETIPLKRKYLCICYDIKENCYWAVSECESYLIYRLDTCFCEVGYITIKSAYQQRASSLCCSSCGNGLWICFPSQMAFIEKCSEKITWYKNEDAQKINVAMIEQCQCYVNCFYECGRQVMEILSSCAQNSIELCVPKMYKVVGMVPCSCKTHHKSCRFWVLMSKVCSHQLVLVEYCVDFSQEIIDPCCPTPCPPKPCPPEPHCGGVYEIMHSIALEEAGIAHILNAEGEKIQKAVAISDNIEQLICVNESVKRTLTQVTLLEGMLYSKLEALVTSCDCQPEPPCSDDCHLSPCCGCDHCPH